MGIAGKGLAVIEHLIALFRAWARERAEKDFQKNPVALGGPSRPGLAPGGQPSPGMSRGHYRARRHRQGLYGSPAFGQSRGRGGLVPTDNYFDLDWPGKSGGVN
jgi:hypothetical protein